MKRALVVSLLSMVVYGCSNHDRTKLVSIASAPAGNEYTQINKDGKTVIPNGRFITPMGKQIVVAPHPFGLTLSPDGKTIITANSGVGPFSISIIDDYNSNQPIISQIPDGVEKNEGLLEAVFMGLAVTPDNKKVFVAGGQQNRIYIFDLVTHKKLGEISCNKSFDDSDYSDGYIGDLTLSKDGSRLYAVDQIGFRLVIIDTKSNQVIHNVKTGRYPFGVTL